jgi:hypothetical protein
VISHGSSQKKKGRSSLFELSSLFRGGLLQKNFFDSGGTIGLL